MKKIKILYYCHTIDFAGTWRSHERIIRSLNKDLFDPYVFYWDACPDNNRLECVKDLLGDKVISFSRSPIKTGPEKGYTPLSSNFSEKARELKFDIIHVGRSGYPEWPFIERIAPLQIETNIFGYNDQSSFCDRSIAICDYIAERKGRCDAVVYNPIPKAELVGDDLRSQYNIPEDAVVCGRIGRSSNFHPIAIQAFSEVVKTYPNMYYIIIGACPDITQFVNQHRVPNVIFIDQTNDDKLIEKFHRTLDLFLHYRHDGECHSTAISQAMMYGLPIISHQSHIFNGQNETIGNGGFVAADEHQYTSCLRNLVLLESLREDVGKKSMDRAMKNFEQELVVKKIEGLYLNWIGANV